MDVVERLLKDLEIIKVGTRENTVRKLGEIGDTRAVIPLISTLEDVYFRIRIAEVEALSTMGDPKPIEPLIKTMAEAVEALGKIGDTRAIEPLINRIKDRYPDVREKAAEALGKIGEKRAVGPLIDTLKDGYPNVRKKAVEALGRIGGDKAKEPLIIALKDEHFSVREAAAAALGKIDGAGAVEPLTITALKDENIFVREEAIKTLSKMGDSLAVEPFINALKDKDSFVKINAIYVLGRIRRSESVRPLINVLSDKKTYIREAALDSLKKIGEAGTLEPFLKALKDNNCDIRKGTTKVLDKIGWKASNNRDLVLYLIAKQEWNKLPGMGKDAVGPLIDILKDEDPVVREKAGEALRNIGDPVALFFKSLKDKKNDSRQEVLYLAALQEWNILPGMGKDVIEILVDTLRGENLGARDIAIEALGEIGDSRAVQPLIAMLKDMKGNAREKIEKALDKIRDRTLIVDLDFFCKKCFLRYKKHETSYKSNIFSSETITYSACSKCHSDSFFWVGIKKVILVLDHKFEESYVQKEKTLIVNWFKREELVDYDEIQIKDANDYEVEKLVMQLRNDMDDQRRKRLADTPVYLSTDLKLSRAKMNLLKDNFRIKIKKI